MLQYVLTINAEGVGNPTKFFTKLLETEMRNLENEVLRCPPDDTKEEFISSYVESLEFAAQSPMFVKDLRVRMPGTPEACCLITKEGLYGGLTLKLYTQYGALNDAVRTRLNGILNHLSASGFSSLEEYFDEEMKGKFAFTTP
jgi:hypothetical protein